MALLPHVTAFVLSAVFCWALIALARTVPWLAGRSDDLTSVQRAHTRLTPRIGGVAVMVAFLVGYTLAPSGIGVFFEEMALAGGILFAVALCEDLGWRISARRRLLTAAIACVTLIVLSNTWVTRIDIPALDTAMAIGWLGIPLTVFAVSGIANAFNLIDGVNGLSSTAALISALALAVISGLAGAETVATVFMILAASLLGFLALNFPHGRIFLGDAGAYSLGFLLCWLGIFLVVHTGTVSPWAVMLTLFWPIMDTLLAIYRRVTNGKPAMAPDRLHVHQLAMRTLEITILGRRKRHLANPLTTLILLPGALLPAGLAVLFWDNPTAALVTFWALIPVYFAAFFAALHLVRSGRITRIRHGHRDDQDLPDQIFSAE